MMWKNYDWQEYYKQRIDNNVKNGIIGLGEKNRAYSVIPDQITNYPDWAKPIANNFSRQYEEAYALRESEPSTRAFYDGMMRQARSANDRLQKELQDIRKMTKENPKSGQKYGEYIRNYYHTTGEERDKYDELAFWLGREHSNYLNSEEYLSRSTTAEHKNAVAQPGEYSDLGISLGRYAYAGSNHADKLNSDEKKDVYMINMVSWLGGTYKENKSIFGNVKSVEVSFEGRGSKTYTNKDYILDKTGPYLSYPRILNDFFGDIHGHDGDIEAPNLSQRVNYIIQLAYQKGVPVRIALATAQTETGFNQFKAGGTPLTNENVINGKVDSTDWGMFQINDK